MQLYHRRWNQNRKYGCICQKMTNGIISPKMDPAYQTGSIKTNLPSTWLEVRERMNNKSSEQISSARFFHHNSHKPGRPGDRRMPSWIHGICLRMRYHKSPRYPERSESRSTYAYRFERSLPGYGPARRNSSLQTRRRIERYRL